MTNRLSRRALMRSTGGLLSASALPTMARAAPRPIKIGVVSPETGAMAAFAEPTSYVLKEIADKLGHSIKINGIDTPFKFIVKDTQSSPNRASEVALELIQRDKVDIMLSYGGPETANPASDQCELNGVPSVSSDLPIEPWFFGRGGNPKTGFDWTFCVFFDGETYAKSMLAYMNKVASNKAIGGLWPNDADGIALSKAFTTVFGAGGYKIIDPGRFDLPASSYATQIAAFKAAGADIVQCVVPPPAFTLFWNQCAQQGYKPKVMIASKSSEYPASINPLGARTIGISVPIWWTKTFPYTSSLTGQGARELADGYEAASGRQWTAGLGSRHMEIEVIIDALRRTKNPDDPASIRDALRATKLQTMCGMVDFSTGPLPNTSKLGLVMVQWDKSKPGYAYPYDMVVVDNTMAPDIPVDRAPFAIP